MSKKAKPAPSGMARFWMMSLTKSLTLVGKQPMAVSIPLPELQVGSA